MSQHTQLPAEGSIVAIRFADRPVTVPFRVIAARRGADGWAYLTGWIHGVDPAEQTVYVDLSTVTEVESA